MLINRSNSDLQNILYNKLTMVNPKFLTMVTLTMVNPFQKFTMVAPTMVNPFKKNTMVAPTMVSQKGGKLPVASPIPGYKSIKIFEKQIA